MKTLRAGVLYFGLVFGAGFVLGAIRVLGTVPRFGVRAAELKEAPIMLLVIVFAAKWVIHHLTLPATMSVRLGAGFIPVGFLLAAEFILVTVVRHLSIADYLAGRDPVAGMVYDAMLLFHAVMPLFVRSN